MAQAGIRFKAGEQIEILDTCSGGVDLAPTPDEINFEVEDFNRKVVTVSFNRVVAEELATHIDPTSRAKPSSSPSATPTPTSWSSN